MQLESRLPDGRRLLFRPIEPSDKELLAGGFERLSPESRYRRFFRAIDHLSPAQLKYLTEVDGVDHVAWVALLVDSPPNEQGVGVARWVRLADEPEAAEAAVTVVDSLHGMGIGSTLLHIIGREAVQRGVKCFKAWVLGDNHTIQGLLREMGARPGRWESGTLEMIVPLPDDPDALQATPAPLILKAVAEGRLDGQMHPDKAIVLEEGQPIKP
ncbi:MAG: N-acetyltransferase family protein [Actinomycetota bacterium]